MSVRSRSEHLLSATSSSRSSIDLKAQIAAVRRRRRAEDRQTLDRYERDNCSAPWAAQSAVRAGQAQAERVGHGQREGAMENFLSSPAHG